MSPTPARGPTPLLAPNRRLRWLGTSSCRSRSRRASRAATTTSNAFCRQARRSTATTCPNTRRSAAAVAPACGAGARRQRGAAPAGPDLPPTLAGAGPTVSQAGRRSSPNPPHEGPPRVIVEKSPQPAAPKIAAEAARGFPLGQTRRGRERPPLLHLPGRARQQRTCCRRFPPVLTNPASGVPRGRQGLRPHHLLEL